ncbi:MvdC/MvdD family ATP grasp protein [Streptomyces sp. 4F14]|uniref:MvdC/MvdD family ATP grasp protein n=1 Tax=Streptomyces sp. 4F14 TaxID=3394380 RepID=UPI003A89D48C
MVATAHPQTGRTRPVCVVTENTDPAADRIVLELAELDVPTLRFDLADFPRQVTLDAALDGSRWTGTLRVHGRTAVLEDIGAILWWHPGRPRITTNGLSDAQAQWVQKEATAGLVGVLASLDCLHLNHPPATLTAQLKADTLVHAVRCGLRVPATWIGNTPGPAREFARTGPSGTVCKSLVTPEIRHGSRRSSFYTTSVTPTQIDRSIAGGAHQLQHTVPKAYEVRLIVVGEDMFAARIDAHNSAARRDFRADYTALTYSHVLVPDTVRTGMTRLLHHYRLTYAAADLIVDPHDRWWFIDLNPAGHYDWLQKELPGLPISAAIARLLAQPHIAARPPAT